MKPRLFKTRAGLDAFMASHAESGGAFHMVILHEDGCTPSSCRCSPWYEVRALTVDNVLDGAKREAKWRKESTS
jgi:hypothetical protein